MPNKAKNSKANTEKAEAKAAPVEVVKAAALKMAASTGRMFERLIVSLSKLALKEDNAKAAAAKAKEEITEILDSAKSDWKVIASEHKDKAERKELARRIYNALTQTHGLAKPRASEMLDKIGLGGLLVEKHKKNRVELPDGIVEMLFALADDKLGEDGEKVKTALSRAYGKAREVYRKG